MNMRANNFKDLTGLRFGKRVVLRFIEIRINGSGEKYGVWLTRCDCGKEKEASTGTVRNGFSCGCYCREVSGKSRRLPNDTAALNLNISKYRGSAAKRNVVWALNDDTVRELMFMNCRYCGVEPKQSIRHGNWSAYRKPVLYNGIDRVDNTRGYESDNVVPCCKVCNRAKDVMSAEEFITWAQRVADHTRKRNATLTEGAS
jgi:hypothetical protein